MIQLEAASEPLLREDAGLMKRELVQFVWREMHTNTFVASGFSRTFTVTSESPTDRLR